MFNSCSNHSRCVTVTDEKCVKTHDRKHLEREQCDYNRRGAITACANTPANKNNDYGKSNCNTNGDEYYESIQEQNSKHNSTGNDDKTFDDCKSLYMKKFVPQNNVCRKSSGLEETSDHNRTFNSYLRDNRYRFNDRQKTNSYSNCIYSENLECETNPDNSLNITDENCQNMSYQQQESCNTNKKWYDRTNKKIKYENINAEWDTTEAEEGRSQMKSELINYVPPDLNQLNLDEFITTIGERFNHYEDIDVECIGNNPPEPVLSINDINLNPKLRDNVCKLYTKLTPIQKYSTPSIIQGRDVIACSETGSGKTAAFVIPILDKLLKLEDRKVVDWGKCVAPYALILAPTRELVTQIAKICYIFAQDTDIKIQLLYGGTAVNVQIKRIKGVHILVSTVGRLLDFMERGYVTFRLLKFIVFDEADQMLDTGFRPEIEKILSDKSMPNKTKRQIVMFSATFSDDIQGLARKYLTDFLFICVGAVGNACKQIEQTILEVRKNQKNEKIIELLNQEENQAGILIFVRTKQRADFLACSLSQTNFSAASIHSDCSQRQREEMLSNFKTSKISILVATSIAARGLDIKGIKHVINYDLPDDIDEYVQRIGRTGRVGNYGRSTSFYDYSTNRQITKDLVNILQQSGQYVPEWLQTNVPAERVEHENDVYDEEYMTDADKWTVRRALALISKKLQSQEMDDEYFDDDWL